MKIKPNHDKCFLNKKYLFSLFAIISTITLLFGLSYGRDHIDPQAVVWLEFKLPPSFETERYAIKLADKKMIAEAFKIYQEHRTKNEENYRRKYELEYKDNPDFLTKNPYKYREFDAPEIDYDAIAVNVFHEKDRHVTYVFVVAKIIREGRYAGQAIIRIYKKLSATSDDYSFLTELQVDSSLGQVKGNDSFVIAGCQESGEYLSPQGSGKAVDVREAAKKARSSNRKIVAIIKKELREEIKKEKQNYKKETNIDYHEELRIAGVYVDLNGDKKADIIASLNNPDYIYKYEDGKMLPTGSRFQLFCMGEKGCEHYLLLTNGKNEWGKIALGPNNCIGISEPNPQGIREKIYADNDIFMWNGLTYKAVHYRPNWFVR